MSRGRRQLPITKDGKGFAVFEGGFDTTGSACVSCLLAARRIPELALVVCSSVVASGSGFVSTEQRPIGVLGAWGARPRNDPRWAPDGPRIDPRCTADRPQNDTRSIPDPGSIDPRWTPDGPQADPPDGVRIDPAQRPHRPQMDPRWPPRRPHFACRVAPNRRNHGLHGPHGLRRCDGLRPPHGRRRSHPRPSYHARLALAAAISTERPPPGSLGNIGHGGREVSVGGRIWVSLRIGRKSSGGEEGVRQFGRNRWCCQGLSCREAGLGEAPTVATPSAAPELRHRILDRGVALPSVSLILTRWLKEKEVGTRFGSGMDCDSGPTLAPRRRTHRVRPKRHTNCVAGDARRLEVSFVNRVVPAVLRRFGHDRPTRTGFHTRRRDCNSGSTLVEFQ